MAGNNASVGVMLSWIITGENSNRGLQLLHRDSPLLAIHRGALWLPVIDLRLGGRLALEFGFHGFVD